MEKKKNKPRLFGRKCHHCQTKTTKKTVMVTSEGWHDYDCYVVTWRYFCPSCDTLLATTEDVS